MDCIKSFQLVQNENLEIKQTLNKEKKQNDKNIHDLAGDKIENKHYFNGEKYFKNQIVKHNSYMNDKCKVNFNEHIEVENFNISIYNFIK